MNIVYLLFSFTVGGTEKLVTDICREMAARGNHVHLYVINKHYDQQMLDKIDSSVKVVCADREAGKGSIFQEMLAFYRYCKENEIDVVHCNSFNLPEFVLMTKVLMPKLKIVYTIHGVGQYQTLNKIRVQYRNFICDSIVAISESVKKDILNYGALPSKVQLVYNAIDLSKFEHASPKKFDDQCVVIGNVARIDSQIKGQDILIKAIGILSHKYTIKCCFAGGADDLHKEDLQNLQVLARNAVDGTTSEITFLGNVDNIAEFLQGIDIFVLPSRFEGFGLSLTEAMCLGIPCVSSDLNGPREIIGENERGTLFKTENSQDLADKLDEIIAGYQRYKDQAEMARDYVRQNYDIRNMCTQLQSIYLKN